MASAAYRVHLSDGREIVVVSSTARGAVGVAAEFAGVPAAELGVTRVERTDGFEVVDVTGEASLDSLDEGAAVVEPTVAALGEETPEVVIPAADDEAAAEGAAEAASQAAEIAGDAAEAAAAVTAAAETADAPADVMRVLNELADWAEGAADEAKDAADDAAKAATDDDVGDVAEAAVEATDAASEAVAAGHAAGETARAADVAPEATHFWYRSWKGA